MRTFERHPLSAEYDDLTGTEWEEFLDGFRNGVLPGKEITLLEGKVLDGWQRYRACKELGLEIGTKEMPAGRTPRAYVRVENRLRRHASKAEEKKRIKKRIERVVEAREAGDSFRTIAEREGVTQTQVQRDLEAAKKSGVTYVTPENEKPSDTEEDPGEPYGAPVSGSLAAEPEKPKRTKGKDGKSYPANKPIGEAPAASPSLADANARLGRLWEGESQEDIYGGLAKGTYTADLEAVAYACYKTHRKRRKQEGFSPPTVDEVRAFCTGEKLTVDPEAFVDHYTSNGWKVGGKTRMLDWRATCRNWHRRNLEKASTNGKPETRVQRLHREAREQRGDV